MGQLTVSALIFGVVATLTVITAMTSLRADRNSLHAAVYVFALRSGDAEKDQVDLQKIENGQTPGSGYLDDGIRDDDFDVDKWIRKTRSESMSAVRKHEAAFKCHEMVPRARALIQTSVESDLEDTYYHVPRAAFIQKPSSPLTLPAGLHIENMLDPSGSPDHHPRCYPQCPVRLRLLPPEPDRLWPRNLVVAECACKETPCSGRGRYQCRQVNAPVLIVRGLPGQLPRYCPEMVPAGCRCIPVRTGHAASFEPFAIT